MRDILYFLFTDHAIFRALWWNTHEIAPGVWRSNHPTFGRLKRIKARGVTHILSLRGDVVTSPYRFERAACATLELGFTVIGLASRDASPKERFIALLDFFDQAKAPFLMHCKSGADRTSLASAFYLIHKCGTPVAIARKQMGARYLHLKWTKTGILDYTLDAFERYQQNHPNRDLRYWLENIYDEADIKSGFNKTRAARGKSFIK